MLVFCLLGCDGTQGEVWAACVAPVDTGWGFAFDIALVAPWTHATGACLTGTRQCRLARLPTDVDWPRRNRRL